MRRRPLHTIANHEWNAQRVRAFFATLAWMLTGWCSWGLTAWHNSRNGPNNFTAAILGVIFFGMTAITVSLIGLWNHEEKRERESAEREKRIAAMEREVFGS